jgi:hypothetical protein
LYQGRFADVGRLKSVNTIGSLSLWDSPTQLCVLIEGFDRERSTAHERMRAHVEHEMLDDDGGMVGGQ